VGKQGRGTVRENDVNVRVLDVNPRIQVRRSECIERVEVVDRWAELLKAQAGDLVDVAMIDREAAAIRQQVD